MSVDHKKLCLPVEVLDQHLVILGKTGSGKSSALRHLVEHLLSQGKRVCVIDPKGDWWGLKVSADGKGPGFPVILFGEFKSESARDVPINDRSGKHIAELVASGNRPCVIGMRGWAQAAMTRFWIDFASMLFGCNAGELYLVIDEFHNFAPKGKILSPEAGQALHWANRLLSEGRGLGIVCLNASQRPQKVHNDSLTSHETLVAMRVIHKADRDAVKDWIDGAGDPKLGTEVLNSLASMPRGEAYVWSPEVKFGPERVKFPLFTTFDSFAPPQLQKRISGKGWADVDLTAVTEKLAAVIEEEKANDPKTLKLEITRLKKELEKKSAPTPAAPLKAQVKRVEVKVITDAQVKRMETLYAKAEVRATSLWEKLTPLINPLMELLHAERAEIGKLLAAVKQVYTPIGQNPGVAAVATAVRSGPTTKPAPAVGARNVAPSNDDLEWFKPAHQRLLNALAWLAAFGLEQPDRSVAAAVAGVSPRSSSFGNDVSRLSANGMIRYPGSGSMELTDEGRARAVAPAATPTLEALHQAWRECPAFTPAHVRLLNAVINLGPDGELSREDLAAAVNVSPKSSSFGNDVSRLSSMGLIEYPQKGFVRPSKLLFPEGVR